MPRLSLKCGTADGAWDRSCSPSNMPCAVHKCGVTTDVYAERKPPLNSIDTLPGDTQNKRVYEKERRPVSPEFTRVEIRIFAPIYENKPENALGHTSRTPYSTNHTFPNACCLRLHAVCASQWLVSLAFKKCFGRRGM